MIQYIDNESIFDTNCEVIVNSVNCIGVMGKGIAKEFRERWPKMFEEYRKVCRDGRLWPGNPHWFYIGGLFDIGPKWILNFPSKVDWLKAARYEYIQLGFDSLTHDIAAGKANGMKSFAFPLLGCGVGGLDPERVKLLFNIYFEQPAWIDVKVYTKIHNT